MLGHLLALDKALFLLVNRDLTSPALDVFFTVITNGAFWIIPGIAMAVLVFPRLGWRQTLLVVILSMCSITLTDQLATSFIKPFVGRLRPCNPAALVEHGRFLLGLKTSFSFPSNHAMNMFGEATLLALLYRRYALYFLTFAAIIAYSRVYTGVHYPLDVTCGAIFGIVCGLAIFGGYRGVRLIVGKYRGGRNPQKAPSGATTRKPASNFPS
jgi:undecaprenyl-diphosphatase